MTRELDCDIIVIGAGPGGYDKVVTVAHELFHVQHDNVFRLHVDSGCSGEFCLLETGQFLLFTGGRGFRFLHLRMISIKYKGDARIYTPSLFLGGCSEWSAHL